MRALSMFTAFYEAFSCAKILVEFMKRDGHFSDKEILIFPLIDRALQPFFCSSCYV